MDGPILISSVPGRRHMSPGPSYPTDVLLLGLLGPSKGNQHARSHNHRKLGLGETAMPCHHWAFRRPSRRDFVNNSTFTQAPKIKLPSVGILSPWSRPRTPCRPMLPCQGREKQATPPMPWCHAMSECPNHDLPP